MSFPWGYLEMHSRGDGDFLRESAEPSAPRSSLSAEPVTFQSTETLRHNEEEAAPPSTTALIHLCRPCRGSACPVPSVDTLPSFSAGVLAPSPFAYSGTFPQQGHNAGTRFPLLLECSPWHPSAFLFLCPSFSM